jgi:predicted enzyme related to lactoylglutathione lyase
MIKSVTHVSLLVLDIDEALKFYTEKLGFVIRENEENEGFRWVTVSPSADSEVQIVLLPACDEADGGCCSEDESCCDADECEEEDMSDVVGRQGVFCLSTDNCIEDSKKLKARGVEFTSEPEVMPWGTQATFADLYGNCFCLVEAAKN